MAYKVGEVAQEVSKEVLGYEDPNYMGLLEVWINDAIEDILYESRWDFNINPRTPATITASDPEVAVDAGIGEIRAIRIADTGAEIRLQDEAELIEAGYQLDTEGDNPFFWWIKEFDLTNNQYLIHFYPVSTTNTDIEILGYKAIGFLDATTDVPLPDGFKSVLKYKVLGRAYALDGMDGISKFMIQEHYTQLDRRRITSDSPPAEKRYKRVQDIPARGRRGPHLPDGYP